MGNRQTTLPGVTVKNTQTPAFAEIDDRSIHPRNYCTGCRGHQIEYSPAYPLNPFLSDCVGCHKHKAQGIQLLCPDCVHLYKRCKCCTGELCNEACLNEKIRLPIHPDVKHSILDAPQRER
jgi:hypothetical protein